MKETIEQVYENLKVAEGVYKLTVKGNFHVKPGQFYMLKKKNSSVLLPRAISVCDVDDEKLTFLYQTVGEGTKELTALKEGDTVQLVGPLGNGFDVNEIKGKVALVAGGIGLAPMIYLSKCLSHCDVDLYAGFRSESYYIDNVDKSVKNIYISTENGAEGHKGYVTDILKPEEYDLILCCGPEIMMFKTAKMAIDKGTAVKVSMENKMACGIGACLVCTCKTKDGNKRTCKEGPVFSGEELELNA